MRFCFTKKKKVAGWIEDRKRKSGVKETGDGENRGMVKKGGGEGGLGRRI